MLNMLNPFYKYVTSLLLEYFNNNGVKPGERYTLQLDREEDVIQFSSALKHVENCKPFIYRHKHGDKYETFSISIDKVDLVVAYTSEHVTPDFLVTLRNLVGEQKDDWANTALISIVSEQLDSIQGGSSDLQKEGMPLHPTYLIEKLEKQINGSHIDKVDGIILLNNLEELREEQDYQRVTFFEFEEIFKTLQKGFIDDEEYHQFGLFKDPELATFKGKEQNERIRENKELFDFVRRIHELGLSDDELESKFSPEGVRELKKEHWMDVPFSSIHKYHQDYVKNNRRKKVELDHLKVFGHLDYWDKPEKESAAGRRKRHVIIFNPKEKESIQFQASFNLDGPIRSLSSKFITPRISDKIAIDVKSKNIHVNITPNKGKATFLKIGYKHDKRATLGAEFLIAIVPFGPSFLEAYKTKYFVNPKKGLQIDYEEDELLFGEGKDKRVLEIAEYDQVIQIVKNQQLIIRPDSNAFNENDELKINFEYNDVYIPFILKSELSDSYPIRGKQIWKLVRENNQDMEWLEDNNRLILGNREFYFHPEYEGFFKWEKIWIQGKYMSAKFESGELMLHEIELCSRLEKAYFHFLDYYNNRFIPSLSTITDEYKKRALEYLNVFNEEVESFKNGVPAGQKGRDLFKLGTIQSNESVYFTPFHPLMVAFKLKVYELLQTEELDNSILSRITPESLVPYIYDDKDILYKPEYQEVALDWLTFKPVKKISVSDANQYLAKVVYDKIAQFKEHFSYLFMDDSHAPLQINVINVMNDKEVLRGIIDWMIEDIKRNEIYHLTPVTVTLYNEEQTESAFERFAILDDVGEFEQSFDVKISKVKDMEPEEVLNIIRSNLLFYKQDLKSEFRYAHISFYKMYAQETYALLPMDQMNTGIALEGLYSSVPSMEDKENYKSGFGTKAYSRYKDNYLTSVTYYVNELVANIINGGNSSYRKGEAIFSRVDHTDEELLLNIFHSSHWVTLVDPHIDLEFFNKYEEDLVVIHYSDQYSSSSRYDAITVTNKSNQYFSVIKDFLQSKDVDGSNQNVDATIKAFNMFNGEWLLRIIGSKGHYDREKLSIISAIKYSISYLDHQNILWVPISLEEVLRVAGAVGLSKSDGVFTARNLGVKGSHSDDLLLIGLEDVQGEISLHFYPIEVKIGINQGQIINKANKQVRKTKKLLTETLMGESGRTFAGRFYRNFFAQLLIANAKKLAQSDFWIEKGYKLSEQVTEKLLMGDYEITNRLEEYIGKGMILSFQKNAYFRSAEIDENVMLLNFTEQDGYKGLVQSIKDIRHWLQEKPNDFKKEKMLSYVYTSSEDIVIEDRENAEENYFNKEVIYPEEDYHGEKTYTEKIKDPNINKKVELNGSLDKGEDRKEKSDYNIVPLKNVRIKIGQIENSNRKVYWEYGNKSLGNRHLLISGKSGQGKTYFMQCLLLEKSKAGISSIVIDYTEGFLPNQLEPEFQEFLGDKLKQKIVYNEKLPINPFLRNVRDIGGIQIDESNTDVAERVKSVFASVYKSLGIQQLNAIYEAIQRGLEIYNESMDLVRLRELLEDDGSNYAKTALSQIRPLIDRNPFGKEEDLNWKDIIEKDGEVHIIQLTGFPRDVQLIITEFILWDLWNYSIRNGDKDKPIPIIMDEAQNLDHTDQSPSARILTEGRKFGLSAWYATQFLRSQLEVDELARLQNSSLKIYFSPPEQEISNIASSFTKDLQEKKYWEMQLARLRKGQCIVHGPILKENGELSHPVITVVDISPLSDRI